MILGMGIDIVEIARLEAAFDRFGTRFLDHILHPAERMQLPVRPASFLAARFAAKEATVKALGTGFCDGIVPGQIEICKDHAGAPHLRLHGRALERANMLGVRRLYLSISHEKAFAIASVLMEGEDG